jgi:hypothetical protein
VRILNKKKQITKVNKNGPFFGKSEEGQINRSILSCPRKNFIYVRGKQISVTLLRETQRNDMGIGHPRILNLRAILDLSKDGGLNTNDIHIPSAGIGSG